MQLITLFALLASVSASRFFKAGKRSKICNQAVEHQKLFEKMVDGKSLANISTALKKSKCVSLTTLIDVLHKDSLDWSNNRFLPVAEILATLAESAELAKSDVSLVRIISFLTSLGKILKRARGYRRAYEYILKAAQGDDSRGLSAELLDSLDADNLMYGKLASQQPRGYPFRKPTVVNDLIALIDPHEQLSYRCRKELQENSDSWLWFMVPFNGPGPWLKKCVADPTLQDIVRDIAAAFEKANQLRLQAASRTLNFTERHLTGKNLTDQKPEYSDMLQRARNYVSIMSNALLQAAIDAHSDNPSVVLNRVNVHFQSYPANGLVPKPAESTREAGKSTKSIE